MKNVESLYIHFPHCRHLCNYCDFYKTKVNPSEFDSGDFEALLDQQLVNHGELLNKYGHNIEKLKTLYIGGGTPSLWGESGAKYIESFLKKSNISLTHDYEFTVEVNPGTWTQKSIDSWQSAGANRFSIGIQSLNESFLPILDRVHSIDESYQTLEYMKKLKVNYSVDFMLGLPHSEKYKRDIISELKQILNFDPSHISLYILTLGKSHQLTKDLPDEDFIADEYLTMAKYLEDKGMRHYEVSNFSRPGRESAHNMSYWLHNSVAALGPSATGFLRNEDFAVRYKWKTQGLGTHNETLDEEKLRLECIYLGLRQYQGIDLAKYLLPVESVTKLLKSWERNGLTRSVSGTHVVLNSKGFLVLDSLLDEIFKVFPDS